jgi:hypothetical protein
MRRLRPLNIVKLLKAAPGPEFILERIGIPIDPAERDDFFDNDRPHPNTGGQQQKDNQLHHQPGMQKQPHQ